MAPPKNKKRHEALAKAVAAGECDSRPKRRGSGRSPVNTGAVDESRTRDLRLGKPTLYQLSYYRIGTANISNNSKTEKK